MRSRYSTLIKTLMLFSLPFCESAFSAETYMGKWDLNGSNTLQSVYNESITAGTSIIRVQNLDGTSTSYTISTYGLGASWKLMGVEDLDGQPGAEIVLSVKTSALNEEIQVISHRNKNLQKVTPGTIWNNPTWALVGIVDTDGAAGKEVVINSVSSGGTLSQYEILHMNGTPRFTYVTNGQWGNTGTNILLGDKFTDTDGKPGSEILVNLNGTQVQIFHDRDQSSSYIDIGNTQWSLLGFSDVNGVSGNEVVIRTNNFVLAYDDVNKKSMSQNVSSSWAFSGFSNIDGAAGNEVVFNTTAGVQYLKFASQTSQPPTQPNTSNICGFTVDNTKALSSQYFRIYTSTNKSLNVENGSLALGASPSHWWSAMWYLEKVEGYYRIVNRWNNTAINIESQGSQATGLIWSTTAPSYWWSAMWTFTDTTSGRCSISNRWKNTYISNNPLSTSTTPSDWRLVPIDTYYQSYELIAVSPSGFNTLR